MLNLRNKNIVVTGGNGFVGSWLVSQLQNEGIKHIFAPTSKELDLRKKSACKKIVANQNIVIHLAAYVGGIGLNEKHPGKLFYDNSLMGILLMEEARKEGVEKMLITGTVCSYPTDAKVPFLEKHFWDGYPKEITGFYGMAKKMLLVQACAYRKEYNFNCIYLVPVNMYGPGDNNDPENGHVIPSLIRRMIEAKNKGDTTFTVWGTGKATREFLFVEDAVEGIINALKYYNGSDPINLGKGQETSIKDLVMLLKEIINFKGKIIWDPSKPDGQKRRFTDISRAKNLFKFKPKTSLEEGLRKTVRWYQKNFKRMNK